MRILKFGGSSLADLNRIQAVIAIILAAAKKEKIIVTVSALQGVTNQLLESAQLAESGNSRYIELYKEIAERHKKLLQKIKIRKVREDAQGLANELLNDLSKVLRGIRLLRHCAPQVLDLTASFGERLSAISLTAHLQQQYPAVYVDSREIVVTNDQFINAGVIFELTNQRVRAYFKNLWLRHKGGVIPVVTGFIGSTEDGRTTTIGRDGSDYSASIFGAALNASGIEIWTDVDGILSADPRSVPNAFVLPRISYEEAMELSYFGARVIHSASIAPAIAKKIPLSIKNTLNPSVPGTLVSVGAKSWEGIVKGISSVDNITLLTLRGASMVGVPGIAERLFRALASRKVNVILISQASSEHTICFAVSDRDAGPARDAIRNEFFHELRSRSAGIDEAVEQCIVAVVGDDMRGTPGVSGKIFQALGLNGINVTAIAQGASERNISFVVGSEQKDRALNVIHEAFFEKRKRLALVVLGVGNIGSALIRQLSQQKKYLYEQGFDLRVCGVADSRRLLFSPEGIDLTRWREDLSASSHRLNLDVLTTGIARSGLANAALVDCTASSKVVASYPSFINANMHIITPNKKANVLPWNRYRALMELLDKRQKHFFYEANVGAGLPVISTLRDLISSGDMIYKIEGILSGALSYLFNQYDGSRPFSQLVNEAYRAGLTEPDPREDLSGEDVSRKLLILARLLGRRMDLKDIRVQSLVPTHLRRGSLRDDFFEQLAARDHVMRKRLDRVHQRGAVLRYVGILQDGTASAGLREVSLDHPFANTKGSDNILAFTTRRYSTAPLVIQGPGAGADVTAMGVFSDILKLLHYLPY